jgi:hypothetical protein
MPYANTPWVRAGQPFTVAGKRIHIDSSAWFAWLEMVSSFCYSSPVHLYRLTLRREPRRRQSYWYAYCKIDAKLHNVYVGKTEQLTQARLEQACQQLARKAKRRCG